MPKSKRKIPSSESSKKKPKAVKPAAKNNTSFLSQLQTLRDFTQGCTQYSETDLSNCLRSCGHNVQVAAEKLITGQYTSSSPLSGMKSGFFSARSGMDHSQQRGTPAAKSNSKENNHVESSYKSAVTSATGDKRLERTAKPLSEKKKSMPTTSTVKKSTPKAKCSVQAIKGGDSGLLLCQRWICGLSTTRNGSIQYNETISIAQASSPSSSSAASKAAKGANIVRFKGNRIEGTFDTKLSSFLSPLLRGITGENKPLIKIVAKGLMGDDRIEIGMEVPLELNVYILQPHDFFDLFNDQVPDESKNHTEYWTGTGKSPISAISRAAFDLLQWAHYSSLPTFDSNNNAKGNNRSENEEKSGDEEEDVDGKNDAEEEDAPKWAQDLYSNTPSPKGADSINQQLIEESDPIMLNKKGVHLKCYQRQALNWMIHREEHANEKNSEAFKRQLELLSELSASHRAAAGEDLVDTSASGSGRNEVVGVQCAVGPVLVSNEVALEAKSLDGEEEPAVHPLWQQRFLWDKDSDGKAVYTFYVNELLQTASKRSPNAPRECCGGILADQMGLGKTVMLLALIAKDAERREDANRKPTSSTDKSSRMDIIEIESDDDGDDAESRPYSQSQMVSGMSNSDPITTLVVAPLSLLSQWEEEVQSKSSLSCLMYYGDQAKKLGESDLAGVDVLITTYGTLQSEYSSRKGASSASTPLLSICFRRVILDEAHIIKNPNTGASKACCEINAERRWCVTGTPISNSLQDVFGLIKFLKHEPWCSKAFWKRAIQTPKVKSIENAEEAKKDIDNDNTTKAEDIGAVSRGRVRRVLQPLLLRRTKDTLTQDGEPILTLPPVEAKLISVTLSDEERYFYNVLLSKSQTVFEGFIQAGTASKSWFAIFALLQRLRQSCDHLALTVKSRLEKEIKDDSSAFYNGTESESPSGEVDCPKNGDGEHDRFIRELLNATNKRGVVDSMGDDDGGIGSQLYTQSVVQSLTQCIQNNGTLSEECAICLDIPSTSDLAVTPCSHIFCRSCLRNSLDRKKSLSKSDRGECPICAQEIADGDVICTQIEAVQREEANDRGTKNTTSAEDELNARDILESALKGKSSSKIVAIVQELESIWDEDPGSKVLIFSQYLGMFDLLKREFTKRSISHLRLDGKMSLNDRRRTVKQFNSSSTTATDENGKKRGMVLLASMKACGVGLNLTAASSVFIVDPWWNHALESQCINRIHRIGQTARKVRVRKFIVTDSVEEKIVKMQERKQGMASEVLSDKASSGNTGNPTLDDFKTIFGKL